MKNYSFTLKANTILLLILLSTPLFAQMKEIGLPYVNNYSRSIYSGGTQNWSIAQDSTGNMFFANNDGVLFYNGSTWERLSLKNSSVVRSVAYIHGVLYAGGFDEFGYFSKDSSGSYTYHSISDLIPHNNKNIDEIWKIHSSGNKIIFQSFLKIFIYDGKEVKTILPFSSFGFSHKANDSIYVIDRSTGLYMLQDDNLVQVLSEASFFEENEIPFIISLNKEKLLIGTINKGIYQFDGDILTPWNASSEYDFSQYQIYSGTLLPQKQIAIGTIQNGIYILDEEGNVLLHMNKNNGLQNNTVLSLFQDRHENLWLGLDNGIDALETSSPISILNYSNNIETSYTSQLHKNILYVGTNQGLFGLDIKHLHNNYLYEKDFKPVEGTPGQVWSLEVVGDQLLCGHNLGTFVINGFKSTKISDIHGGWDYIEIPWNKSIVIGGTYSGLTRYEQGLNSDLKSTGKIEGFNESSKELYFDKYDNLWLTHGYKGIFRIELSNDAKSIEKIERYRSSNGLPELPYTMTTINGEFLVVAKGGLYSYDPITNKFTLNLKASSLFSNSNELTKVIENKNGDIWYFSRSSMGVLRAREDGGYIEINTLFKRMQDQLMPYSFENIFTLDQNNVFIGSPDGLIHYDPTNKKNFELSYACYFSQIQIKSRKKDSMNFFELKNGGNHMQENIEVPFRNNSLSFHFTSPYFESPKDIKFAYRLDGDNDQWSEWTDVTIKEYNYLKEGKYTFEVKAKNIYEHESPVSSFAFTILPPWYRTKIAFASYFTLFAIFSIILSLTMQKRIEHTKQKEKEKANKAIEQKEQEFFEESKLSKEEIERLRNEKFAIEMRHKDMELANATYSIIQKNKFMNRVKNDVNSTISKLHHESNKQILRQIVKRIDRDIKHDKQWKVFDKHFDEVHSDFSKKLKDKHPELTPNDLRICAYLKMNISTKEIAPLMNISIRGVEISRYRLRKKLHLDRNDNLTEYIMNI